MKQREINFDDLFICAIISSTIMIAYIIMVVGYYTLEKYGFQASVLVFAIIWLIISAIQLIVFSIYFLILAIVRRLNAGS
jgi:hypothetical protein